MKRELIPNLPRFKSEELVPSRGQSNIGRFFGAVLSPPPAGKFAPAPPYQSLWRLLARVNPSLSSLAQKMTSKATLPSVVLLLLLAHQYRS